MPSNQISESRVMHPLFPFHDLDNNAFLKATGALVYCLPDKLSDKHDLYEDTLNQDIIRLSKLVNIFMMQLSKMGSQLCIATLEV